MDASKLADNAQGDSVTEERLTKSGSGGLFGSGHDSILSYLNEGEQPHFICEIYHTVLDGGGIGGVYQYCTITDERIRLTSTETNFTISFDSITNIGYGQKDKAGLHYVLSIECVGTVHDVSLRINDDFPESELNEAVDYINSKRNGSDSENQSPTALSPSEKMEQLKEMHENGLLKDSEFEEKKDEILDQL